MIARLNEVISFSDDGEITGLQFDSRERRIQQWREKKEAEQFAELCEALRKRNVAREARQDPDRLEKVKENHRRHYESGKRLSRVHEYRREKYYADPVVNTCQMCGKEEVVPYEKHGQKKSKFCSQKCRRKDTYQRSRSKASDTWPKQASSRLRAVCGFG